MKMLTKITIALALAAGLVFSSGYPHSSAAPVAELAASDARGQVVMRTMPPDPPKPDKPKPKRDRPLFPFAVPTSTGEGRSV